MQKHYECTEIPTRGSHLTNKDYVDLPHQSQDQFELSSSAQSTGQVVRYDEFAVAHDPLTGIHKNQSIERTHINVSTLPFNYDVDTISYAYTSKTSITLLEGGSFGITTIQQIVTLMSSVVVTLSDIVQEESLTANTVYYVYGGYNTSNELIFKLSSSLSLPSVFVSGRRLRCKIRVNSYYQVLPFLMSPSQPKFMAFPYSSCTNAAPFKYQMILLDDGTIMMVGNANRAEMQIQYNIHPPIRYSFPSPIKQLSIGYYNAAFVAEDGTLYTSGGNATYGQRGIGNVTENDTTLPPTALNLTNVTKVIVGCSSYGFMAALDNSGNLWTWGCNGTGSVGDGTTTHRFSPYNALSNVADFWVLDNGFYTTMYAVKKDGTFYTWGKNTNGQCGVGSTTNVLTPTLIYGVSNVKNVYPLPNHTQTDANGAVFVLTDSVTYFAGPNNYGQSALGYTSTSVNTFTPVPSLSTLPIQISGNASVTICVFADGSVKTVGYNATGLQGTGNTTNLTTLTTNTLMTDVAKVICGTMCTNYEITLWIKKDGTVWSNGCGNRMQLGVGYGHGANVIYSTPLNITGLSNIVDGFVSGRSDTGATYQGQCCYAVRDDGTLFTWGDNYYYQNLAGRYTQEGVPLPTIII